MGIFHTVTEGGQILSHRYRMFRQVLKIASTISLLCALVIFIAKMLLVPTLYYQGAWYTAKIYFISDKAWEVSVDSQYWGQVTHSSYSKSEINVPVKRVLSLSQPYATHLKDESLAALSDTFFYSSILFWVVIILFLVSGRRSKTKKLLSGKRIVSSIRLRLRLKLTRKASPIRIGSIPLVKGTETQHIMITGGTGAGKTNCLHQVLKQLREQGNQAVIVDTTGVFVDRYFDPKKDVLFNPFDSRSSPWTPWAECENACDYASLAESFIPQSYSESENYWRVAARSLFCSVLDKFENTKKTSEITKWLLYESLPNLCRLVQGTKAASHLDPNSEKAASSVRSVASTFLESLECLKDSDTPISIKGWLKKPPSEGSWLFLNCLPSQRSTMLPLLSAWISSAIRGLITLPADLNRRIWFIIDELPSLQKIKDLELLLAEGRKYGGCCVLSLQSPAQIENIYGREVTQMIIGNTATKVVFSEQDPEVAARISKAFGEKETQECKEGISYGAHESRDSVNLSTHTIRTPAISATQIHSLKKNTALIKLPGDYPISKVKLKILRI